jgi:hypothetical protein
VVAAADVAAADAALDGVAAASPGARAASAKRDRLTGLMEANCYGRVRHRRPGHALCTEAILSAYNVTPGPATIPNPIRRCPCADWLREFSRSAGFIAWAIERGGQASCVEL